MRCPQSHPATISCRQTMTASKTFGGVAGIGGAGIGVAGIGGAGIGAAGIGGAGERRRFERRRSLTYTINARPQNMRMGRRMHDQWPPSRQRLLQREMTLVSISGYTASAGKSFSKNG